MEKTIIVGGVSFTTTDKTLRKSEYFNSVLSRWEDGDIKLDRDPDNFRHVLAYLRDSRHPIPEEIYYELCYYGIDIPETNDVEKYNVFGDGYYIPDIKNNRQLRKKCFIGNEISHKNAWLKAMGLPAQDDSIHDDAGRYVLQHEITIGDKNAVALRTIQGFYTNMSIVVTLPALPEDIIWKKDVFHRILPWVIFSMEEIYYKEISSEIIMDVGQSMGLIPKSRYEFACLADRYIMSKEELSFRLPLCWQMHRNPELWGIGTPLCKRLYPYIVIKTGKLEDLVDNYTTYDKIEKIKIKIEYDYVRSETPVIPDTLTYYHERSFETHKLKTESGKAKTYFIELSAGFIIHMSDKLENLRGVRISKNDQVALSFSIDDASDYNWRRCGRKPPKTNGLSLLLPFSSEIFGPSPKLCSVIDYSSTPEGVRILWEIEFIFHDDNKKEIEFTINSYCINCMGVGKSGIGKTHVS